MTWLVHVKICLRWYITADQTVCIIEWPETNDTYCLTTRGRAQNCNQSTCGGSQSCCRHMLTDQYRSCMVKRPVSLLPMTERCWGTGNNYTHIFIGKGITHSWPSFKLGLDKTPVRLSMCGSSHHTNIHDVESIAKHVYLIDVSKRALGGWFVITELR